MQAVVYLLLVLGCTAIQAVTEGQSDDGDWWAYQWYEGEPFRFKFSASKLNISMVNDLKVIWDTPTLKGIEQNFDDDVFQTVNGNGIYAAELLVKSVQMPVHGVYKCHVFDAVTGVKEGMIVYGLNIHEPKLHTLMDRYRHNIIVAFVATAVFFVPLATTCFVWKFQYRSEEEKYKLSERKQNQKHMFNGSEGTEMKHRSPEGIAVTVQSPEGQGAYDNLDVRL